MADFQLPAIDLNVILQLAIVFGWAIALLLVNVFIPGGNKRIVGYLAIVGLLVAAVAGIPLWNSNITSFAGMVRLDNYSLSFNWLFLGVSVLTILISLDYLQRQNLERGEYYVLIMFATGGMMLLAQGADLIALFLGLELLSITLYVLAGFAYPRISSEEAGMKYLLIGAFAAGFLVFGIALIYGATGTSNLAAIDQFLRRQTLVAEDYTLLFIGSALVMVGFGYKIAMAPFHMWTPDVYEGSPTPVAALMSVGTKAAGFAALTRFLLEALPSQQPVWAPALAVLAAVTMLWGNISAVVQRNVKRMLAYSSIGHAGYILMGPLAASDRGVQAMLFYLVSYALANLGAFTFLVALEEQEEGTWDITEFTGIWAKRPWMGIVMAVSMVSLAGVPPTAGFVGKLYVIGSAWSAGYQWLALIAVIASAIAAFYYIGIVVQMFMRRPVREIHPIDSRILAGVLAVTAVGIIAVGLVPAPIITLVERSVLALGQ